MQALRRNDGRVGLRVLRTHARGTSISIKRLSKRALARGRELYPDVPEDLASRPHTVGDCHEQALGSRSNPCPWVSCPYHLYLDVDPETGSIKLNFPDKDVDELEATCCLYVAEHGPETLERTGELMNVTRERVRQIETLCLGILRRIPEVRAQAQAYLSGHGDFRDGH